MLLKWQITKWCKLVIHCGLLPTTRFTTISLYFSTFSNFSVSNNKSWMKLSHISILMKYKIIDFILQLSCWNCFNIINCLFQSLVDEFDELQRTLDAELEGLENLSRIEVCTFLASFHFSSAQKSTLFFRMACWFLGKYSYSILSINSWVTWILHVLKYNRTPYFIVSIT